VKVLRAETLIDCIPLNKVQGKPFKVAEIVARVEELLLVTKIGAQASLAVAS
jgi:hypothetical protein